MELLDLVLFGNVCKLLQKPFQVAAEKKNINIGSVRVSSLDLTSTYAVATYGATDLNLSGVRKFSKWKSSSRLF